MNKMIHFISSCFAAGFSVVAVAAAFLIVTVL
jgi:hypothetical protein